MASNFRGEVRQVLFVSSEASKARGEVQRVTFVAR